MEITRLSVSLTFAATFALSCASAAARDAAFTQSIQWSAPEASARGLFIVRITPDLYTTRMLVEAPNGSRLVLTQEWIAQRGIARYVLLSDEAGWWIEVTKDYRAHAETVPQFFQLINGPMAPRVTKIMTRTSTGASFEADVPVSNGDTGEAAFVRVVRENAAGTRITGELPPDVRGAVPFIRSTLMIDDDHGLQFNWVLAVVEALVPGRSKVTQFEKTAGPRHATAEVDDADQIAFVSRFRTVGNPRMPLK
jgi:hypothetical protein